MAVIYKLFLSFLLFFVVPFVSFASVTAFSVTPDESIYRPWSPYPYYEGSVNDVGAVDFQFYYCEIDCVSGDVHYDGLNALNSGTDFYANALDWIDGITYQSVHIVLFSIGDAYLTEYTLETESRELAGFPDYTFTRTPDESPVYEDDATNWDFDAVDEGDFPLDTYFQLHSGQDSRCSTPTQSINDVDYSGDWNSVGLGDYGFISLVFGNTSDVQEDGCFTDQFYSYVLETNIQILESVDIGEDLGTTTPEEVTAMSALGMFVLLAFVSGSALSVWIYQRFTV